MTEISIQDRVRLLQRFPKVELSYETIPHTKVSPDYNVCMGIPIGTKGYAWMTFYGTEDVCFILETNKERNITRITKYPIPSRSVLANGTLLYGTIVGPAEFVIEDLLYYKGIPAKTQLLNERLGFIQRFFEEYVGPVVRFHMAPMWTIEKSTLYDALYEVPKGPNNPLGQFHHVQYRCLEKTAPYLNVFPTKKGFAAPSASSVIKDYLLPWRHSVFSKPQYRTTTVFLVRADIQFDIYRLFAYGGNKVEVYYGVACIPNYKTSVMMNRLFRRIPENECLDAAEESEDESDFENVEPDKYVDLVKELLMEFRFHLKWKKWVPVRVVEKRQKVVHITQL